MVFWKIAAITTWILIIFLVLIYFFLKKKAWVRLWKQIILGHRLHTSIDKLFDEVSSNKKINKETLSDTSKHILWRLTRIGVFAILAVILPTLFLIIQIFLLSNQNALIQGQNNLFDDQNYLVKSQTKIDSVQGLLLQDQNSLFESQNNLVLSQLKMDSIQGALINSQNFLFEEQNKLIEKQSDLLIEQNERLKQQNFLQEASRRNSSAILLSNVIDGINNDLESDYQKNSIRDLSPQTIASIIAIANQFKPYKYFENDDLIENPLSPERGQLLIFLYESNLDIATYDIIFGKANFAYSDVKNSVFQKAYFKNARLEGSNFSESKIYHSNFAGTNLEDADFSDSEVFFSNFDFSRFFGVKVSGTKLLKPHFRGTRFSGTIFDGIWVNESLAELYSRQNKDFIEIYEKNKDKVHEDEDIQYLFMLSTEIDFLKKFYDYKDPGRSTGILFEGKRYGFKEIKLVIPGKKE